MAPAAADETLLASLGGVHVGTTDNIHAARAHMVERQEPVLALVDLESDVIETRRCADAGIGRREPAFLTSSESSNNTTS